MAALRPPRTLALPHGMGSPLRIVLDLATLGELMGRVVGSFCDHKGVEFSAEDDIVVAQACLDALEFMFDRAEFARTALSDIDGLPDLINFEPCEDFPGSFKECDG